MQRFILLLSIVCVSLHLFAQSPQSSQPTSTNYLAGAVTTNNGFVEFQETIQAPGKTKAELFEALKSFVQKEVIESEIHLPNTRFTELNLEDGIIAASVTETLWFKRKALVSDFAEMHYQLVFVITEGRVKVTMRRISYDYEAMQMYGQNNRLRAEDWIVDKEALSKDGKRLTKVAGRKFRAKTIDRKNQLFRAAAKACGA